MPFPKELLNEHEDIILDVHPHWLFFAEPALALVVAIALAIFLEVEAGNNVIRIMSLVVILGLLIWFSWRALTWRTTHFVITSDRVIYRSGVFAKRGIQIPIERVNNVNFHQGIFERIVGAGDLLIESAGTDGQQRFTDVRHPDIIQNLIHAAMDEGERRSAAMYGSVVGAGSGPTDVATQLEKLEGMLNRGTLTQAEFDSEKRRLLGEHDGSATTPSPGSSPLPPPPPPSAGR
jgi:membrane protein YdbS with pleckstrin-like domain